MTKELTIEEAFSQLDEEDQKIVNEICAVAITALINESGGMVVLADLTGHGDCRMLTVGNQLVAAPLLAAAKRIVRDNLEPQQELLQ